jgi:hypothetical protein
LLIFAPALQIGIRTSVECLAPKPACLDDDRLREQMATMHEKMAACLPPTL